MSKEVVVKLRVTRGLVIAMILGVALVSGLLATGIVSAADSTTVHACTAKSSGELRVVKNPNECKASERPLSFNKRGPAGPQGPEGIAGIDGTSVTSASLAVGDTNCPNGGSAFTASSGTTYTCNGAKGDPGPAGTVDTEDFYTKSQSDGRFASSGLFGSAITPTVGENESGPECILGEVQLFSGRMSNFFVPAEGQLLLKSTNAPLYSVIGNEYGGNDTTFALPDLRGAEPKGEGLKAPVYAVCVTGHVPS